MSDTADAARRRRSGAEASPRDIDIRPCKPAVVVGLRDRGAQEPLDVADQAALAGATS